MKSRPDDAGYRLTLVGVDIHANKTTTGIHPFTEAFAAELRAAAAYAEPTAASSHGDAEQQCAALQAAGAGITALPSRRPASARCLGRAARHVADVVGERAGAQRGRVWRWG